MNLLSRLTLKASMVMAGQTGRKELAGELRSYFVDNISPKDPYMVMLFGAGTRTKAGQYVDDGNALKLAAFFSAVSLIASSVASLPCGIRKKKQFSGDEDKPHYLNEFLAIQPNQAFTPYQLIEWCLWRAILKGNAYVQISRDADNMGLVDALWPLEPDKVTPFFNNAGEKKFRYVYRKPGASQDSEVIFDNSEIIHIPGFMYDGLVGYSILDFARESVGSGLATDEFGARFFSGDGVATGVITHPQRLKKEAKMNIKSSYKEQAQGSGVSNESGGRGVIVLDEGMSFSKTGITPEEGQFLGTREFTVEEMCRWFHIPLYMMAVNSTGATMSAEEQWNFFVNLGLKPWMNRFNEQFNVKLLNKRDRELYEPFFDTSELTLMTMAQQLENASKARNMGLSTVNEISNRLQWPLFKGEAGEQRMAPSTMKVLGDTDPSFPVPIDVLRGYTELLASSRDMSMDQAMAIGKLLMPTADEKLIRKSAKPFIGKGLDDDDGENKGDPTNGGEQR